MSHYFTMDTSHKIFFKNSSNLSDIPPQSINLIVTSPPYPMIKMWDDLFSELNPEISIYLDKEEGNTAFHLMHLELEKVWSQFNDVLCNGGVVCINIGDATRKIGQSFQLFPNHSYIINYFEKNGFEVLPPIIWRKQTNKPNKFMGSGMYPPNAYVTLEHEYILIFRKKGNRIYSNDEKIKRKQSAYFWEERNIWFSDIWFDLKGTPQKTNFSKIRDRSGAFPFELAYRLINMYSIQGDWVLDPFFGTGTTSLAAMISMRNSIGYEIDKDFKNAFESNLENFQAYSKLYVNERINKHRVFISQREKNNKTINYTSKYYKFKIITRQETDIFFPTVNYIHKIRENEYIVEYDEIQNNSLILPSFSIQKSLNSN